MQGKFDLLHLRDDLERFIKSPQFMDLAEDKRDNILDLLPKLLTKVNGCKGCDPWKTTLGTKELIVNAIVEE